MEYKAVLPAGTYSVFAHIDKDVNRGILQISVAGSSIGTVDMYSATRVANNVATISTTLVVGTSGLVLINAKATGKNGSSAGYYVTLNAIEFVRTA